MTHTPNDTRTTIESSRVAWIMSTMFGMALVPLGFCFLVLLAMTFSL